jgi:hypothetical protein
MADFPIQLRSVEYRTDQGQVVRAKRGYLFCEFTTPIVCHAFLDTAAPFGVVPHMLSRHLSWQPVAASLTPLSGAAPGGLTWQGIPCDLGSISFNCVHTGTGVRSPTLRMLAKFPRAPASLALEHTLVLGMSLLDENPVRLLLDNARGGLVGHLSIP